MNYKVNKKNLSKKYNTQAKATQKCAESFLSKTKKKVLRFCEAKFKTFYTKKSSIALFGAR